MMPVSFSVISPSNYKLQIKQLGDVVFLVKPGTHREMFPEIDQLLGQGGREGLQAAL